MAKPTYGSVLNPANPLSANLVALYLLNETSGTVVHDLTSNALNSTSSAGLDWTTSPNNLTLNGTTTYADMGTSSLLAVPDLTTRSFELYFNLATETNGYYPVVMQRINATSAPYQGYMMYINAPNDAFPRRFVYATANFGALQYHVSGAVINPATDYHVVVTQAASGDSKVYLNGVFVSTAFGQANPNNVVTNFALGRNITGIQYFPGTYYKMAVYNAVLSAADVASLYADPWQQVNPPTGAANRRSFSLLGTKVGSRQVR